MLARLFFIVAALVCAQAYDEEEGVLVLHDSDFDAAILEFNPLLVEFYAPWCGHCKKLAPEYAQAAAALMPKGLRIAKVDATVEKALGDRFKIQGFPTLKFFRGSDASASEYGGGRTADEITAWVTKKSGPSTVAVESRAAADELVASSSVVFVGVFGEDASALRAAFEAEAAKSEDSVFAVAPQSAAGEFGGEGVVALNNFEGQEHAVRYGGAAEAEELGAFVAANSLPLVVPFSQKTVQKIFAGAIKTHFLLFAAPGAPEVAGFRAVAAEGSGKMLFVTVAPEEEGNDKVLQYFGVTAADIPAAAIVNMAGSGMKKFMLPAGEVTEGGLREFAAKFNAGSLKPSLKSEKPTADKDDVRVLVGENFEELVLNGPEEVSLVEFYAPWCGHCKSLAPKWLSLATHYKKEARVGIFNMDYTANEIDHPDVNVKGFPTIIAFVKQASGPKKVVEYDGAREEDAFKSFISGLLGSASTSVGADGEQDDLEL